MIELYLYKGRITKPEGAQFIEVGNNALAVGKRTHLKNQNLHIRWFKEVEDANNFTYSIYFKDGEDAAAFFEASKNHPDTAGIKAYNTENGIVETILVPSELVMVDLETLPESNV